MSKRSLMTVLVIGAVFLAGALAGAAVVRLTSPGPSSAVIPGDGGRGPGGPPRGDRGPDRRRDPVYGLARLLDEELELSQEQQGRVEEILERRSRDAREIFRESRRRFRSHLDSTVSELMDVLSPEQAAELQRLLNEMRERHRDAGEDRSRS